MDSVPDSTTLIKLNHKFGDELIGYAPQEAALDKGFYTLDNVDELKSLDINRVCIPKIGKLTPQEHRH